MSINQYPSPIATRPPLPHAPFDVGFLTYDISRLNLTPADRPVLDTCAIPKSIFPHA